jgi:ketosteroid isomerase-like protein
MPQFSGPHRGSDRAVQLIMDAGGTLFVEGTQRLMILQSVAEGDQVAVRFRMSGRTQGGVVYDNLYAFFFRIAADKIAELWENVDTAYVYGALGIIPDWLTDVP